MKAYGIPKYIETEIPDKDSIQKYGMSTSDRCVRADRGKNKIRRYWKKVERRNIKLEIKNERN